jgi:SAM-dependent methyltransferase
MPRFVLGIDYAMIDILDKNNGAYNRMLKDILKLGKENVPDIVFVAGDVTTPIITGEAGRTEEEKKMLRTLFGQNTGGGVAPYIDDLAGILQNKADVISCMFALHYFFKDKTTFDGFLRNVADCLKVGGYFVGCCFDGGSVFELLRDVKTGDSHVGKQSEEIIWTIRKDYEGTELPTTDDGFGKAITVEFASIGLPHQEYLMPWDLLVAKMDTIGCELVKDPVNELGLKTSTNLFSASYEMAKDRKYGLEKFPAIQQFSFLNRWFIFKRVTDGKVVAPSRVQAPAAPVLLKQGSAPRPGESVAEDLEAEAEGEPEDFVKSVKPVEPQATYAPGQVIQFSIEAPITKDDNTRKWLSLMIPVNIPDQEDPKAVYPTIEHFLAGMKYKFFSNQPEKAALFQITGFYGISLSQIKIAAQTKAKKYYDLLTEQLTLIKKNLIGDKKTAFKEKADSGLFWRDEKMRLLKYALEVRLEKDESFQAALQKVKGERQYLLSTGAVEPDFNGVFKQRKIVGENKLGKALMELVDYTV